MKKLTPKQQTFVNEYLVDLNATQAAIRAGYSKKNADKIGFELLGKTGVAKAIAKARAERAEKTQRTALDVLKDIQAVTREAWTGEDLKTALKGLELEGRHLGMFIDRKEIAGKDGGPVQIDMAAMTDTQLQAILGKDNEDTE